MSNVAVGTWGLSGECGRSLSHGCVDGEREMQTWWTPANRWRAVIHKRTQVPLEKLQMRQPGQKLQGGRFWVKNYLKMKAFFSAGRPQDVVSPHCWPHSRRAPGCTQRAFLQPRVWGVFWLGKAARKPRLRSWSIYRMFHSHLWYLWYFQYATGVM